jgi:hypothetical protein
MEGVHTFMEVQAMAAVADLLALSLAGLCTSWHKQINSISGSKYSG